MVLMDRSTFLEGRRVFELMSCDFTSLEKVYDGERGLFWVWVSSLKFKDPWFCVPAFVDLALVTPMIGLMEHCLHLLVTKKKSELE